MNNKPVDTVVRTSAFNKAYKKLKKANRDDVIKDIDDTIIKLINFEITTSMHNHPLRGEKNKGICDIHIRGDIVLLYEYVDNVLKITLVLKDLVNHKELKRKY